MQKIKIPWSTKQKIKYKELFFREDAKINVCEIKYRNELNNFELIYSIKNPINSDKISKLVKNKKRIIILIDDSTRRTPIKRIFPYVIAELRLGGIKHNQISILIANGCHRPLNRFDFIKKIGKENINKFKVINHNPYEGNVYFGKSNRGTPIFINEILLKADFKIAIGSILPHINAVFSGGCKMVIPGCAGIETVKYNHSLKNSNLFRGIDSLGVNDCRKDIEQITNSIGLDFIINIVMNSDCKIAGIFSGNSINAHRKGAKFAKETFKTNLPQPADVAVFNAFPEDIDFMQILKALNIYYFSKKSLIHDGGVIVITSACVEGLGVHYLYQEGMSLYNNWKKSIKYLKEKIKFGKLIIFSPNIDENNFYTYFGKDAILCNSWNKVTKELNNYFLDRKFTVNIFPMSAMQIPNK